VHMIYRYKCTTGANSNEALPVKGNKRMIKRIHGKFFIEDASVIPRIPTQFKKSDIHFHTYMINMQP
jgi:hypothetical protein